MKISVTPSLFDRIPGLCIGVVAVRAADNAAVNMEAEAFRRRCCTEANLLLKMNLIYGSVAIANRVAVRKPIYC